MSSGAAADRCSYTSQLLSGEYVPCSACNPEVITRRDPSGADGDQNTVAMLLIFDQ
jgi:hypothetical protein